MKKQCQKIAKSTQKQCQNRAWIGDFCFSHYPHKGGFVISVVLSAILGLILGVVFQNPFTEFLSSCPLFHYLDKQAPTVNSIRPNLNNNKIVYDRNQTFVLEVEDKHSGIDLKNSRIEILYKLGDKVTELESKESKSETVFQIEPKKPFKSGEYNLRVILLDRAKNDFKNSYPLIVKENENISFYVSRKPYAESGRFKSLPKFQEYVERFSDFQFYVFTVVIMNATEGAFLRDLHLILSAQIGLFSCLETSNDRIKGFKSEEAMEAYNKLVAKDRVFSSMRVIEIEEIAPNGTLHMVMLGGNPKEMIKERPSPFVSVWGQYVFDGYGIRENCKIDSQIQVKEE